MMIFRRCGAAAFLGVITILLSVYCNMSFAELINKDLPYREGFRFKDLLFHSAIAIEEQIDTNIFLQDSDTKLDFITVLNPSVGLEIPLRDNRISLDYDVSVFLYGTYHNQNHVDQRVRGLAEFNLADYKITVDDEFNIFTLRASDENSNRVKRNINNLRAGVEAQFELLGFDAGYTNRLEMYGSPDDPTFGPITYEDRDRMSNAIDATVSYRFLPKTKLLLENDLGLISYYNSAQVPDSFYDEVVLGILGEWFPRMDVNFKAGIRFQGYDNSDIIADKAYIGPVFRGGFDYDITDDDTVVLNLQRAIYESIYANMNYYDVNLISVKYEHRFNDKISANAFGSYQINFYPSETTENGVTAKRYDNFFTGGVGLRYDIRKWLSCQAKYEYKQRISRFDVFDYIGHSVTVRGVIGF